MLGHNDWTCLQKHMLVNVTGDRVDSPLLREDGVVCTVMLRVVVLASVVVLAVCDDCDRVQTTGCLMSNSTCRYII
jgi:hypothetical protein